MQPIVKDQRIPLESFHNGELSFRIYLKITATLNSRQNRFIKEFRQSDRLADGSNERQSDEQTNRPVPVGLVPLIRLNVSLALLQMAEWLLLSLSLILVPLLILLSPLQLSHSRLFSQHRSFLQLCKVSKQFAIRLNTFRHPCLVKKVWYCKIILPKDVWILESKKCLSEPCPRNLGSYCEFCVILHDAKLFCENFIALNDVEHLSDEQWKQNSFMKNSGKQNFLRNSGYETTFSLRKIKQI